MNFGAFGYLYDGSSTRDGGVLRALSRPIDLEISDTGAFYPDPFGLANASRGIIYSGTANYLNKLSDDGLLKKERLGTGNYYINTPLFNLLSKR